MGSPASLPRHRDLFRILYMPPHVVSDATFEVRREGFEALAEAGVFGLQPQVLTLQVQRLFEVGCVCQYHSVVAHVSSQSQRARGFDGFGHDFGPPRTECQSPENTQIGRRRKQHIPRFRR
ncbi:MAG TPA: hypothetical protein VGA44_03745 [Steroidobacteraceae bacterium]